jgi:nicotinamide-nucleotide adenylyltransferase
MKTARSMSDERVLMVGRFQPIHLGHIRVINEMAKDFASVILGIGSAQYSHTLENPFTAGERVEMIQESLHEEGLENFYVLPIEDINEHGRWVAHVTSLVPRFAAVVGNNPLTQQLFKESGFKVRGTPLYDRKKYSGTEIRNRMLARKSWKQLVPKATARIIDEIEGVERLRHLAGKDE